ncbi:winged helix-turn-helix transcriptional regulator [Sphingomonas sp. CL5.1]|uniref:MarR family winged helix-turn-helix transcriptional regulator n=1 Tax=Sphingomonas sp. CL5.1 TaxID=2653203 RepID=UPI0015836C88|nr:MarR family winged helix-turn-helix transcriptional regulator [Sphingomonas sp. CL5.1]QKS01172.1 winged helix-turn-helix transcriptional regulator [Sphingomonas sp. CL5.1]
MAKRAGRPPSTQDALEDYLPYLVNRLASLGQAVQNKQLAVNGVNVVTLRTLSLLHIQDGRTVNEIAALAFAEQSTASRAIDAMVTAGLVERRISEKDMRRREIVLTEKGREVLRACWPLMEDHYARIMRDVAPADLQVCRRVLARMIDNIR